jgi:transposase-like protein
VRASNDSKNPEGRPTMKVSQSEGANITESESPQCPACEASHSLLKGASSQYVIYLCNECRVEYAWPRTIQHDHYYENVYDGLDEGTIIKKSSERFLKESMKSLQVWHIEGLKWLTASQKKDPLCWTSVVAGGRF